jgi:hypothetical protein
VDFEVRAQVVQQCEQIFKEAAHKRKNQPYMIVALLGLGLFLLAISQHKYAMAFWVFIGTSGVLYALYKGPYYYAMQAFRSRVLPEIAKCVDPLLNYSPQPNLTLQEIAQTEVINSHYNRFRAEDQFSGKWKEVDYRFCEIRLRRESGSGKNKKNVEVFSGVALTFEYPKVFQFKTLVHPDRAEGVLGGYVAGLLQDVMQTGSRLKRVQLEHPDFEKKFKVMSENENEARFIFTPKKMELMIQLSHFLGDQFSISFCNEKMYLVYPSPDHHFGLKGPEDLDLVIGKVESVFNLIKLIIETLDLDSTLYKKQG